MVGEKITVFRVTLISVTGGVYKPTIPGELFFIDVEIVEVFDKAKPFGFLVSGGFGAVTLEVWRAPPPALIVFGPPAGKAAYFF